jgi:uncharacterized repeat protein (TIGR02543 family)
MRRPVWWGVVALVALGLGVTNAAGRTHLVTLITVQVVGKGTVTSSPSGIKCGSNNAKCYISFTESGGSVTLTADAADNWDFDSWGPSPPDTDPCGPGNTCDIPLDGMDHTVMANFSKASGTETKTLSVSAPIDSTTDEGGNVQSHRTLGGDPEPTGPIYCGSNNASPADPVGSCSWTVPKGSVLTVRQTPTPGYVFNGWGGACSGSNVACTVILDDDRNVAATWSESGAQQLLTVTVSGQGTVTGGGMTCPGPATCTKNEPAGATITLHASPKEGSTFTGWSAPCAAPTGSVPSDTCTFTMDNAVGVTASFATAVTLDVNVVGNGNVSGGSGAINCGAGATICSGNFTQNSVVTLVATPVTGATFVGWTGPCGGTSTTCTVSMNQSKSVTATFSGGTSGAGFLLTVSVSGTGTVTGGGISCGNGASVCTAGQTPNATVTLTATPAAGAAFAGWGGACTGTSPTCSVLMNAARSVSATFTAGGGGGGGPTFLLSVSVSGSGSVTGSAISCGNGAVACSANFQSGTSVTLTARPAAGATFSGWGGACFGTAPTCTVSMTSTRAVTATFTAAAPGTLSITVTGNGAVSTSAGKCIATGAEKRCVQHLKGSTATLTATPAAGQTFGGWGGSCASAGKKLTCTLSLKAARTVIAAFTPRTTGGGGGGTVGGALSSRGVPLVRRAANGFRVTLRFNTTKGGLAHVRGLRAGRTTVALSLRVGAGPATIGPFQVSKPGLYTFQATLAGRTLTWRTCLGRCGRLAPGPNFVLVRQSPTVTRSGDVWSVTLHLRANVISAARVQAFRGTKKLVDQRFLAKTGAIAVGPFLLGPGAYTLRLTAADAYGRTRTLTWIVSLAR